MLVSPRVIVPEDVIVGVRVRVAVGENVIVGIAVEVLVLVGAMEVFVAVAV